MNNNMNEEKINKIVRDKLQEAYTEIMGDKLYGDADPLQENRIDEATDEIVEVITEVFNQNPNK